MTTDTIIQSIDSIASTETVQEVVSQANNVGVSDKTGLTIAILGLLIFAAHLFTEIFSRKRIPDVLLLMIIGLIIGPVLQWVSPSQLGSVGSIFTTVTLVILLFESGTQLNFNTLLNSIGGTMKLTTINFFVTMAIVAVLGILLAHLDIATSLMLGAILGGTSSAVVIPMVSQLKISKKSGTILILESAFSDVLCIVFALALLQVVQSGTMNIGGVLGQILSSFILASIIGLLAAVFWSYILDKVRHVKNSILTTPAFVFIVYGINEWLGFSGAIASLAFGIGMANIDRIYNGFFKRLLKSEPAKLNDTEKQLFSEIVFLLKTFFFIYIGISIRLDQFWPIIIGLIFTVVLFALRIPIVRLSIRNEESDMMPDDRAFMASILPKGLAAAVLATLPAQAGIPGGETIQNIVFAVILFSIIFTSIMVPVLEKDNMVSRFYKKRFTKNSKALANSIEDKLEEIIDNE
ncbi:MAG: cation:proton antiporter [Bacteroidales bacterium]|nr:cation:proton antiporter [Bacteroidales bacterium]